MLYSKWELRFVLVLFLAALALVACATTPANNTPIIDISEEYSYTHPKAQVFAERLVDVLSAPGAITSNLVTEVTHGFAMLPRSEMTRADLFEIKYAYEHWRHAVSLLTVERLSNAENPSVAEQMLTSLSSIPVAVGEDELLSILSICRRWSDSVEYPKLMDRYVELLLLQGDSRKTKRVLRGMDEAGLAIPPEMDGPDKWIRIRPSYKSAWPFERWSRFSAFTQYRRGESGVLYRGIEFRPGDVLIINLQNPSEGVFTLALDGPNYSPHMGMYIDIETDQGSFPAVYEIHSFGVRVVPLHVFLSDTVSSYVEVFRHRDAVPEWKQTLSTSAKEIIKEDQGFNLFADEEHSDGNHYLTCTTAIEYLVARSGFGPSYPDASTVSTATREHLYPLGFRTAGYLSPTDILQWEQLELVGIIDNGFYVDNITRQLVNERFSERLASTPLRLDNGGYLFFRWAIELVLENTPILAPLLRSAFGFSKENFPMGTKELLAFMELIQMDISKSVENLRPFVAKVLADYPTHSSFSIHALIEAPEVRRQTDVAMAPIDRWF